MFTSPTLPPPPAPPPLATNANHTKKKRRPAGTPDPDAEVVSLSPRTLLESDRYVCDICNQGFQRDQNLQMHRRRHKVPWKLVKRESSAAEGEVKKRVFVCPDPSCLHHEPNHALGDLVGIKKHFRRKHSDRRQWVCERCCKGYAVQSDYKAHLKTCGTRGHSCDCGRVFSRVESFIEHQDACNASRARPDPQTPETVSLSRTSTSPSPSTDAKLSAAAQTWLDTRTPNSNVTAFLCPNLELHILPTSTPFPSTATSVEANAAQLHLSLWPGGCSGGGSRQSLQDQLRFVIAEKALADEARQQAKLQVELAEQEFTNAKRIRQQAQAELNKALVLRDHAARSINSILFQITCHACRQRLRPKPPNNNSLAAAASYMSSAVTEEQELV